MLMYAICLPLNSDALHLLWSVDKTFEWNTASIMVRGVLWAAALERSQRKKQNETEKLREHILKKVIQRSM